MFFTRVYRPHMAWRVVGFFVFLLGVAAMVKLAYLDGKSSWWAPGAAATIVGLLMALWVRKVVFNETERHVITMTGLWPIQSKHIHPIHQLRSIKLSVTDHGASKPDRELKGRTLYRAYLLWNSGRSALLMSGPKIKWIERRAHSLASAMGIPVEPTEGFKRYREKVLGRE
jgi:hypothetical protein